MSETFKDQATMSAAAKSPRLEASLCERCYEVFFSKASFNIHKKKCVEPKSQGGPSSTQMGSSTLSKCANCSRIFLGGQNLAKHVKKEHGTRRVVKTLLSCASCNKLFMDAAKLAEHKEKEHPATDPSATADAVTTSERERDVQSQPKVATKSQPKLVPKVVTIPKPTLVETDSQPKSECEVKIEAETTPAKQVEATSTPSKSVTSEPTSPVASEPRSPVASEPTKTTSSSPEPESLSESAPVSMSVLDVDSDGSTLLLNQMVSGSRPDSVEIKPEVMSVPSDASPDSSTLREEDPPTGETVNSPPRPMEQEEPNDDTPRKSGDVSVDASVTDEATPTVTADAASAVTTDTPTSVATSVATAAAAAAASAAAAAAVSDTTKQGVLFACGACNVMFLNKGKLLRHLVEHHNRPASIVKRKSPLPSVKKTARKTTIYACAVCGEKFDSVKLVNSHIELAHAPRDGTAGSRDTLWSTRECILCSALFQPSVRLRDIFMNVPEWTQHFFGEHGDAEKLASGKRLELWPCHRCGVIFFNKSTRSHHNAISHEGKDPEAEMKRKKHGDGLVPTGSGTAEIKPKSLSVKARSKVIVDSLMKASLVSRSTPTVTMDKEAARRAQSKVFAAKRGSGQRVTNVVFKCSKCGGMFPDDPSFEQHAREAHGVSSGSAARTDSSPALPRASSGNVTRTDSSPALPRVSSGSVTRTNSSPEFRRHVPTPPPPPPPTEDEPWDVFRQRECSECSKLMEACPRSFALFVRRDVWERHVKDVHVTGRWRCTGERLQLHPCSKCPRLFLHPSTLEGHQAKLHDTMVGPVDQAEIDACSLTKTPECSRCLQLVQNSDGLRYLDGAAWKKHFETEHKELLLCDGKAGEWQLFPCNKCQRLFFNAHDLPTHEARQAYMHMSMPANAQVVTRKRGQQIAPETEILYQCANEDCAFTSRDHGAMVTHSQQCRESQSAKVGETLLYKTLMVRKPPRKPKRYKTRNLLTKRLDNVIQKLTQDGGTDGGDAGATDAGNGVTADGEAAAAVSQLLQTEPGVPAVLELDPVTCQPLKVHSFQKDAPEAVTVEDVPDATAAEDVPEAAAEEETVAAEEPQPESSGSNGPPTRMDFACSVCKSRGSTREEIVWHIRSMHKRSDGTFGPPTDPGSKEKQGQQVKNYKSGYLCGECKVLAKPCPRTGDLYFEKAAWIDHLAGSHKPVNFTELDRLDLHECLECEHLYLSYASRRRHMRCFHEPGSNWIPPQQREERRKKHKFNCVEEGCTFTYHRVTRLRAHLISEHNFDLAVREVMFNSEHDFQEWKKSIELSTNAYFVQRSNVQAKRKDGKFDVRYFCCSRVMNHMPTYKVKGKKHTMKWHINLIKDDMVWRCPAFMKAQVAENSTSIRVSFCPNHYGHDMDPSWGRLNDADEAEISGMLRAGLSVQDVQKRMREAARLQGTPSRKQRITEAEINVIYQKCMGTIPPKLKRYHPELAEETSRTPRAVGKDASRKSLATKSPSVSWNADLVTYDDSAVEEENAAGDELSLEDAEVIEEVVGPRESWQRVCGEEGCRFTTTSVGYLRSHLSQRHGFAMHIDTAGFLSKKDFMRWKRNLEKRTCAKYTCYKTVPPSDPSDSIVTRYFTCHRSGLNTLKRAQGHGRSPRKLVLCTGYMKVRCDNNTGEVACEYCASHYGHDAKLADRRTAEQGSSEDMMAVTYEMVDDTAVESTGVDQFGYHDGNQFDSPSATRYSFIPDEGTASEQEVEPVRRPRGRPAKKRVAGRRRSRGGKRRRWEEFDEVEEEEEEQQEEYSFESD